MQADSPELDKFLKQFIAQQRNYFNYLSLSETSYSEQDQTQHKKCSEEAFRISSLKNKRKKTLTLTLWLRLYFLFLLSYCVSVDVNIYYASNLS